MTREEAIKELKLIAQVTMWNDRREAVEMAIEALSADAVEVVIPNSAYCDENTGEWYIKTRKETL